LDLLLNSTSKILVLENNGDKNGQLVYDYNKIVLYNDYKYRYELTDNRYITNSPVFNKTGDTIYFLSARRGSPESLLIQGEGAPKQIYGIDIKKLKIEQINYESKLKNVFNIDNILVFNNNNFFLTYLNRVYSVKNGQMNLELIIDSISVDSSKRINKSLSLNKLSFDEDNNLLAISVTTSTYIYPYISESYIVIYNFINKQLIKINQSGNPVLMGGWLRNKLYYMVDNVLKYYSCKDSSIKEIDHLSLDSLKVSEIEMANQKELYMICYRKISSEGNIYHYDIDEKKIEQFSNYPAYRTGLRVYSKTR
jgi:hypothetical protein